MKEGVLRKYKLNNGLMNPESLLSRMTSLYCGGLGGIETCFPAP